ncbi:chromosome partitioning protein [Desulfosporosinus lacus DSM 15449]|uniref:Sporulation initiation inhibitor protein Soj n=2 Tax=Desulfosporosinus TaxID=79206 RepID=A0A1M5UYB8_9FIRM|nr:chromosome partitioning protein [Desulfosporosinus lacus DSM 15449]
MENCKIIAIANQKGGTGKTTTAYNMGIALAEIGKKILLVDNDPQTNLTTAFGIRNTDDLSISLHDVLTMLMDGQELPDKSEYILRGEKLDLIPSSINLSVTEINLRDEMGGERTLSNLLEPLREDYDYIIIDTNPYLGLLTINALAACDSVIIPVSTQLWSANGLTALLNIILKVQKKINPRIRVSGILITMTDERTILFREAMDLIDEYFKDKIRIYDVHIPVTVKIGEANFHSRSVLDFDAKNKAARAYAAFAKEVIDHGDISGGSNTADKAQASA